MMWCRPANKCTENQIQVCKLSAIRWWSQSLRTSDALVGKTKENLKKNMKYNF